MTDYFGSEYKKHVEHVVEQVKKWNPRMQSKSKIQPTVEKYSRIDKCHMRHSIEQK